MFADEGFLDMEVGEKAMLRITSDYAYGPSGAGGVIPPNADLNFEVCIYNMYVREYPTGSSHIHDLTFTLTSG